jgi:4,5-DOPA dioxygenase extradiol
MAWNVQSTRLPIIFVGHGSPMNAIEDNEFARGWQQLGKELPRPSAIICISAHWETRGVRVTAMDNPRTIHDFWGFPDVLYKKKYRAPGSPALARHVQATIGASKVILDADWGLDHGAWSVLSRMYPAADIPVIQIGMDHDLAGKQHHEIGKKLSILRDQGVLIVGSGNLVHNLGMMEFSERGYEWAIEFDAIVKHLIESGNDDALIKYETLPRSHLPIPTPEHWLPLLYVLGARDHGEPLRFITEKVTYGAISMRGAIFG